MLPDAAGSFFYDKPTVHNTKQQKDRFSDSLDI